jgi:hypothetical protein
VEAAKASPATGAAAPFASRGGAGSEPMQMGAALTVIPGDSGVQVVAYASATLNNPK